MPVAFWLLTPFLRRVPIEIEQTAAMDGAGPLRTLLQIVTPIVAPGIVATLIIVTVLSYNEFLFASAFTSPTPRERCQSASRSSRVTGGELRPEGSRPLAGIAPVYCALMQRYLVNGFCAGYAGLESS